MFDKKQKSCVKRIHLVTDDGLYDRKAFYTVKIVFYSSSMNDGEFINYFIPLLLTYFDLPSYSSNSRKRYILMLLLMLSRGWGERFPVILGRG